MGDHAAIRAWLVTSRQWSTPLHHLGVLNATRARTLLRNGADVHAVAAAGSPSPLSLAQQLDAAGEVTGGSAAALVLAAAQPWSAGTHALFPAAARARAVELTLLGHRISRLPRFAGKETAIFDVWVYHAMPLAVCRSDYV